MTGRQRIQPDDEVYRVRAVWHGPTGTTLPFSARYLSWGVWLAIFVVMLLIRGLLLGGIHGLPMWELSISIFVAHLILQVVDHERPFRAHAVATYREAKRIVKRTRPQAANANITLQVAVGPKRRHRPAHRHEAAPSTEVAVDQTTPEPEPEPAIEPAIEPGIATKGDDNVPVMIILLGLPALAVVVLGRQLLHG